MPSRLLDAVDTSGIPITAPCPFAFFESDDRVLPRNDRVGESALYWAERTSARLVAVPSEGEGG